MISANDRPQFLYSTFAFFLLLLCIIGPNSVETHTMPAFFFSTLFILETNTPIVPPIIGIFFLGMIQDALTHMPFGTYALTFMLFYVQLLFTAPHLPKIGLCRNWLAFCIILSTTGSAMYLVGCALGLSWHSTSLLQIFLWGAFLFPILLYILNFFKKES